MIYRFDRVACRGLESLTRGIKDADKLKADNMSKMKETYAALAIEPDNAGMSVRGL